MDAEDFLAHHGVMGMKWGKRKARNQNIRDARIRQESRRIRINETAVKLNLAKTKKGAAATAKLYNKQMNEYLSNPDFKTSKKYTTGEKAATTIIATVGVITAARIGSSLIRNLG